MKIAIVGGGVMGEAILSATLETRLFKAADVTICEVVEARRNALTNAYGVTATADASVSLADADLAVLSIKPQDLHSVRGTLPPGALLISIMAGVRIATLQRELGHDRIVRAMPNTPVSVKAGMSVWTATSTVTRAQRELARGLFAAIGREIYVDDEKKLDMATAVSGSGPGYVFLFIEAMIDGGVGIGLTRQQATEMVLQTFYGSALYAQESGKPAAELRGMVTSPAGTTAAGLFELEKASVRAAIIESIRAAHQRAIELGGPA
ncbi:MAG: pyrroline-5-carboxylate reductase [Anaerolineaceae bacterium]